MTMQWFAVLLVAGLTASVTSVRVAYLNADGATASEFDEGDTVIIRCNADYTDAPFTSAKLEWQPYDSDARVIVADGEQIIDQPDRFSGANLTNIGENTMDYRVTIKGLDRYDNGYRFYCQFIKESGDSTGAGGVASKLTVNWQRPSLQCKHTEAIVKKDQDLSYKCSVTDADARSNGSLSLWKNGDSHGAATVDGSPADPVGTQYNVSYTIKVTEEVTKDDYMCRYRGIGGFEEYSSSCTFEKPDCVVDDLALTCGAASEHDRVQIMAAMGLSLLIVYWAV